MLFNMQFASHLMCNFTSYTTYSFVWYVMQLASQIVSKLNVRRSTYCMANMQLPGWKPCTLHVKWPTTYRPNYMQLARRLPCNLHVVNVLFIDLLTYKSLSFTTHACHVYHCRGPKKHLFLKTFHNMCFKTTNPSKLIFFIFTKPLNMLPKGFPKISITSFNINNYQRTISLDPFFKDVYIFLLNLIQQVKLQDCTCNYNLSESGILLFMWHCLRNMLKTLVM